MTYRLENSISLYELKFYCVFAPSYCITNLICMLINIEDLVLPLIINPNEKITRILRMIEIRQNGLCVSCRGHITRDHAVVSSGRPGIKDHLKKS